MLFLHNALEWFSMFLLLCEALGREQNVYVVLHSDGKTPVLKYGSVPSHHETPLLGWGGFRNEVNSSGWSFLEIHTNESFPDDQQAFSAGLMEGILTGDFISKGYQNTWADYCTGDPDFCLKLGRFLADNTKWMMTQIDSNPDDKYWYQVKLILKQLEGLEEGYYSNASLPRIPDLGFLLMQISGDLDELQQVLGKKDLRHVTGSGSCSALIKVLPGNRDLYISQVTWSDFVSMLRIFKLYDLPYSVSGTKATGNDKAGCVSSHIAFSLCLINNASTNRRFVCRKVIPGKKQSFSSYPGVLFSGDDFYLLSSGMVSQETTIGNSNLELLKYITATGVVLEWMRTILANRLASTTVEWAYMFSRHNSGTYNNQWMILDYKLFTPGEQIQPGTLTIVEQLPGIIEAADMSVFLQEHTYWPSYNLPYFPYIYNMSGARSSYLKYGSWFSYELNPRGQIFRRDHNKVVDMESMMKLMRYNDYKHDPFSRCNCTPPYSAENSISARSDLNPADGKYLFDALGHRRHGGTDAKITNSELFQKFQCIAVSGPTHDQQPVFKWSTSGWKRPMGHPDAWDFEPLLVTWD